MSTSIAFTNRKGGTFKSTGALTLSVALAALGHSTVLVDCDTQGSLSGILGMVDELGRVEELVAQLLRRQCPTSAALRPVNTAKIPVIPNLEPAPLHLIPGALGTDVAIREMEFQGARLGTINPLTLLSKPLDELPPSIEYAIIDLGPSHPLLTTAVYMACDYLIIPTHTDFLSLNAVMEIVATLPVYQEENPTLRILGIVPTFTRRGTINHDVGMAVLRENYADLLMSDIPYRTIWAQAAWDNQTVMTYAPSDVAAEEAWNFADEVLDRLEVKHHARYPITA